MAANRVHLHSDAAAVPIVRQRCGHTTRQAADLLTSDGSRVSPGRAEKIAARTVNKQRARSGEANQKSKTAMEDISAPRRGGIRSGNRYGPGGRTKAQLYADTKAQGTKGRSKMTKAELEAQLAHH